MAESNKSIYRPSHPEKYKGNPNNIICRSSWERKFAHWCDNNSQVVSWSSEEFCIRYLSPIDNKVHRYFPDYLIKIKEESGEVKTYLVEVKPKKQTEIPKKRSRVTKSYLYEMKTYEVNQAKWKAAEEWCKDRKIEFKIITEEDLFSRK